MDEKPLSRREKRARAKQVTPGLVGENPDGRKSLKPTRKLGTSREFRGSTPQAERQGNKVTRRWVEPAKPLTPDEIRAKVTGERVARGWEPRERPMYETSARVVVKGEEIR